MTIRRIVGVDLVAGLVVSLLGFGAMVESIRMPRFENRNADPLTLPGITPGLIGLILGVLGVLLTLRALRGLRPVSGAQPPIGTWPPGSALRTMFTVVMVSIYGIGLFGRIDFLVATAAFIFVFTVVAEVFNPDRQLSLPMVVGGGLLLATVAIFTLRFVFEDIFLIRLPG